MLRTFLLLAGLLSLGACGAGGDLPDLIGTPGTPPGETMSAGEHDLALQVFALVNQARADAGLAPVAWDEGAADVAYDHAVDMRLREFFAHVNPDGLDDCDRLTARHVPLSLCGAENIALGEETAAAVMATWMASAEHRETILGPSLTHVGIGVHTGTGGPWWVQDFFVVFPE